MGKAHSPDRVWGMLERVSEFSGDSIAAEAEVITAAAASKPAVAKRMLLLLPVLVLLVLVVALVR